MLSIDVCLTISLVLLALLELEEENHQIPLNPGMTIVNILYEKFFAKLV